MNNRWNSLRATLLMGAAFVFSTAAAFATDNSGPSHLQWARTLVQDIQPANNIYDSSPSFIHWAGVNGAAVTENQTVCATLITELLKQAYGWNSTQIKSWTGSTSPNAALYYQTITAHNGFVQITSYNDIQPGDLIAVYYPTGFDSNGNVSSGHMMLVNGAPAPSTASGPVVSGAKAYEVSVIDSCKSYHGPFDTRLLHPNADGSPDNGVGQGILRLYAKDSGEIVGYTWSTYSNSQYFSQAEHPFAVGRLNH